MVKILKCHFTGNPYGPDRECGGSSGGEGSLIGGGGSILGIGNDIGGSLRIPSALCGAVTLKPTSGRDISMLGCNRGSTNQTINLAQLCVSGFMSSSLKGVVAGLKSMWDNPDLSRNDKNIVPMPWDEKVFESKR